MNKLRAILSEHFQKMLDSGIKFRDTVIENVEKFINCGSTGYATFACEDCGIFHHVNFRCKSRFCTTCGNRYNIERAQVMATKILDVPHRHCVFTIPDTLRMFFRRDYALLHLLFQAVSDCTYRQFGGKTPAFICVLHTFGRDLKWNPHIHVVLAEGSFDKFNKWRPKGFFSYESLRKSFQAILLKSLLAKLGEPFKPMMNECYKSAANGFFVHAPKQKGKIRNLINYIGRYLGRPAIGISRIDGYDGKNVTFHYKQHETDKPVSETISAEEFIKRLVVHIPPRYFNMVRFYGAYAKANHYLHKLGKILKTGNRRLSFQMLSLKTFGVDPHKCSMCGKQMVLYWLTITPNNKIHNGTTIPPPSSYVVYC